MPLPIVEEMLLEARRELVDAHEMATSSESGELLDRHVQQADDVAQAAVAVGHLLRGLRDREHQQDAVRMPLSARRDLTAFLERREELLAEHRREHPRSIREITQRASLMRAGRHHLIMFAGLEEPEG